MQETTQVTYGEGTITVMVSTESETEVSAPDIRFGDYYQAVEASFTVKELEEISEGSSAFLDFHYVMTDEPDNEDEAAHFESGIERAQMLTGPLKTGVYFEVKAEKSVDGEEVNPIDTLYDDIEFQYELPRYLVAEKRAYYAMTDVMGVCDIEEDVDEDADTLSVSTHNIGTTLILYQDGKDKAGQNQSGFVLKSQHLFILAIFALGLAWWALDKRYRQR
ncbi:hypothetical protein [Butyrivibrio sp. XPD2006]|uniref:hypothetical protein n=1 Tax=Butyrivibrio sp. XPD2006 TaxID=1280668 RepID=UPI0003B358C2|nr:hypothetical protein [Butyrivibrio sp. XPD2006]